MRWWCWWQVLLLLLPPLLVVSGPLFGSVFGCLGASVPVFPHPPARLGSLTLGKAYHSWLENVLAIVPSLSSSSRPLSPSVAGVCCLPQASCANGIPKARGKRYRKRLFPLQTNRDCYCYCNCDGDSQLQVRSLLIATTPVSHPACTLTCRPRSGHTGTSSPASVVTVRSRSRLAAAAERQSRPVRCQLTRPKPLTTHDLAAVTWQAATRDDLRRWELT